MRVMALSLLGLLLCAPYAWAHNPWGNDGQEQWAALISALVLVSFWGLYSLGAWRRPPGRGRMLVFHLTTALCALALLGPLDGWAETSTAAHMAQHMTIMVIIAPLWVLCRPWPQVVAAGGRVLAICWQPMLSLAARPMVAAYVHGVVIWFWHTPAFYSLAVVNPWWHIVEHACFLVTAGVFWWAILTRRHLRAPWALLALLFTLMHTGFLGALLTFARAPLYGEARDLQDQQLAGLIMWVLGAIPYLGASAWISHRWYRQLQRSLGAGWRL